MVTSFQQQVYNIVRRIPRGKVSTYAAVAKVIGRPRAARAVGNALNKNPEIATLVSLARPVRNKVSNGARDDEFSGVPCHRVIRSDGKVGGYIHGTSAKIKLLRKERIGIKNNRVVRKFII